MDRERVRPPAYAAKPGRPFASSGTSWNTPGPALANTIAWIDAPIAALPASHLPARSGGIASVASSPRQGDEQAAESARSHAAT